MGLELREFLFQPLADRNFQFSITAREEGLLSGVAELSERLAAMDLEIVSLLPEGSRLASGMTVLSARGCAARVAQAEELLLGTIGKPSGVATAAAALVRQAGPLRVVCGAWKKVNPALRQELRRAVTTGGASLRITDQPFVYLDKNYVRMFGGVAAAVKRARLFDPDRLVVVQLRGEGQSVVAEAAAGAATGAAILMVDTGRLADLTAVVAAAAAGGWREMVQLAYAGGLNAANVGEAAAAGADLVDVGRAIIDAPLLDFSLDVEG